MKRELARIIANSKLFVNSNDYGIKDLMQLPKADLEDLYVFFILLKIQFDIVIIDKYMYLLEA